MFKNILLPVDLSDKHGRAMDAAADLVRQGGEVTLLHVVEVIAGLSLDEEKAFYTRLGKVAQGHLKSLGDHLGQRQVSWRAEVLFGSRGPEVVRFAKEKGIDLIVLTSPRVEPDAPPSWWGSLSYKIGIMSPCPVLLVK